MSRHRNVRNYAYEDEMSEDVYGHSVEEYDMCISPSTAQQFMYNRGNDNQQSNLFSNYMSGRFGSVEEEQEEEQSEDEDHLGNSQDYRRPQLDPISEAKLSSCLDQLQSVLGDDCHEPTAVDAILKYNFDAEKALDYIFSKENKKDSSQKKTARKQDSNLHHKLLKKNIAMKSKQRDAQMGKLQHSNTNKQSTENNNSIPEGRSLLSMPLSSIEMEDKESTREENKSASNNQVPLTSLGTLISGSQQEHSSMLGSETSPQDLSRSPLLSVSLKSLAEEQMGKEQSIKASCSQDALTSMSLSSMARQPSSMKSIGLSGISLQDLANQVPSSLSKMSQSSSEPVDMLASMSLSSLAKQHDESTCTKSVGISGISLQDLANQVPSSLSKMSQSSKEPVDMLAPMSLSSLAKEHDESTSMKSVGLSGISLQDLANPIPSSLARMSQSSIKPVDMLASMSLSSLAKQHDESTSTKPVVLSGISLQDLANQIPSSFSRMSQSSNKPLYQDVPMSSLSKESFGNTYPGQNTQISTRESPFTASLSSLASLSLDSSTTKKSPKQGQKLPGKTSASLSIIPPDDDTLKTENKNPILDPKQSKKKLQGSRCEESYLKVHSNSIKKKKRTHKVSQSSMLLMHPSMFAQTLCYKSKRKHSLPAHMKSKRLCTSGYYGNSDIAAFNFLSPSPDDVIKIKQRQRFGAQHKK